MAGMKDITGLVFHRLTVIRFHSLNRVKQATWECRCECGNTPVVLGAKLRNGHTKSCGCLHSDLLRIRKTRHNMTNSPTYHSWTAMLGRCNNPRDHKYPRYGGRGITVCERWRTFENFYSDMGDKPAGTSIDRINNDGDYEPGNCRWATPSVQGNNTSTNRPISAHGKTMNLKQWATYLGRCRTTIERRLKQGLPPEQAMTSYDLRRPNKKLS